MLLFVFGLTLGLVYRFVPVELLLGRVYRFVPVEEVPGRVYLFVGRVVLGRVVTDGRVFTPVEGLEVL